jgi:hypothetical protein
MTELPTVELPVNKGTVFVVPLPVTFCAAALAAKSVRLTTIPHDLDPKERVGKTVTLFIRDLSQSPTKGAETKLKRSEDWQ